MLEISVPQSRKALIKSHIKKFNQLLSVNGLGKVTFEFGNEFVANWFVTERVWNDKLLIWSDIGVKKSVKLEKLKLTFSSPHLEEGVPVAYLSSSLCEFDDLLNEPVSCLGASFDGKPISHDLFVSAFDGNRSLRCEHCLKSRTRDKVLLIKTSDKQMFYGCTCLKYSSGTTISKLIKWFGYYDSKFDDLHSIIKYESRLVTYISKPGPGALVSVEAFIDAVHFLIRGDQRFIASSFPQSTGVRALCEVLEGEKFKSSDMYKRFVGWMKNLKPKNKFLERCKSSFSYCVSKGVSASNVGYLSAIYALFLKDIQFHNAVKLDMGKYSGLLEVESHSQFDGGECTYFKDKSGRRFMTSIDNALPLLSVHLVSGNLQEVDYSDVYSLYVLNDVVVHKF
jgi:hypothetical protein